MLLYVIKGLLFCLFETACDKLLNCGCCFVCLKQCVISV